MAEEKKYPFIKILLYRVEYAAAKLLGFIANTLSVEQASALASFFGRAAFHLLKRKRQTALDNLAIAFPGKSEKERFQIARGSFESAAISMAELFMMKKIAAEAEKRFDISGLTHLQEALAQKQGVILGCSHLGAWECHEMIGQLTQTPIMVIVKNLKNPFINQEINRLRRLTLIIPHSKDVAIRGVMKYVKKKGIAAILIDQWAGPEGVWIPFFGKETSTTTIAARFAKKTEARLIPSFCIRTAPGRYKLINYPEITFDDASRDAEIDATQKLNHVLEEMIRLYPEQWIWGHRRWKDKPEKLRIQQPEN